MPAPLVFLLLCLLAPAPDLRAQSAAVRAPAPYVFLSPLKAVEPVNRGLLGGGGYAWASGWAAEGGYLWLFPRDPEAGRMTDQRGHRFHAALRRYVYLPRAPALSPFVQLRTDRLYRRHRTRWSDDDPARPDPPFDVLTRTTTANLMAGLDYAFGHLSLEFSLGFGYRWRHVRYVGGPAAARPPYPTDPSYWYVRDRPGRNTSLSLPIDLRVLYHW